MYRFSVTRLLYYVSDLLLLAPFGQGVVELVAIHNVANLMMARTYRTVSDMGSVLHFSTLHKGALHSLETQQPGVPHYVRTPVLAAGRV